jgi:hypothetical protein
LADIALKRATSASPQRFEQQWQLLFAPRPSNLAGAHQAQVSSEKTRLLHSLLQQRTA